MLLAVILLACMPAEVAPSAVPTTPPAAIPVESGQPTETASTAQPGNEDMIPRITAAELKAGYDSGADILIVDTRSKEEYNKEHIEGAVSAPLGDIVSGKWLFPEDKDREIIFYCT